MSSLLFLIGALFALLWMVAPFVGVALAWSQRRAVARLHQRVEQLERRLAAAPETGVAMAPPDPAEPPRDLPLVVEAAGVEPFAAPADPPPGEPVPGVAPREGPADPPPPPAPAPPRWQPPSPERVILWFTAGFGGLGLVVAALLALQVAVEKGWLVPSVRVSGALVAGTAAWIGGLVARGRTGPWVGAALSGAGAGILYGAMWAGSSLYGLIPNPLAWGLTLAVTAAATLQAARLGDRLLAWLALGGGLLTPVLLSQGAENHLALFAWLTLLGAGIVAVAARRRWPALLLGAAAGVGALFVAWSARWYTAEHAPTALLGVGLTSLPFAVASAGAHAPTRRAAWTSLVALGLLAAPWLGPLDPVFHDPRSGERVVRHLPRAAGASALAVTLLPLAPWLLARRGDRWQGGAAGAVIAALTLVWALAWARGAPDPWAAALAGAGPLALGAVVTARRPSAALGLFPLPVAAGASLALGAGSGALHGDAFAVGVAAVALAGFALARTATGWALAPALAGVALPLWAAAADPAQVGLAALLGPTLLALALFSQVPSLVDWRAADRAALGAGAVSGVVLLPPLLAAWSSAWGAGLLGLAPALVAADTLLAAAALRRAGRLRRTDAVFGLYVAAALFGLSAALPLQLGGRWLTVAWALEMAGLAALSRRARHPVVRGFAVALALVIGARLLLNPFAPAYGPAEGLPFVNWTAYTWGVPLACFLVAARAWPSPGRARDLFGALAVLVGFALVELQVRQAFGGADPAELGGLARYEGMVRSVSWAAYGFLVLRLGALRDRRALRFAGFAFVLLAAIRVFAVDLWGLEGFARVGSVGGIAVTLLLAAFTFEPLVRGTPRPEDR